MRYLIGADIGTTGTKTVVFTEEGRAIASAYRSYEVYSERADYAEQNAVDWWNALVETVREATKGIPEKREIAALSLSTQGGSLVAADGDGLPTCRAISWLDHRVGEEELVALRAGKEPDYHYLHTGWPLGGCYNLAQIKWLQNHQPEVYRKSRMFLSTSDYLHYHLTGRAVTDYTNAGITNLEDLRGRSWDEAGIRDLGIAPGQLGELRPSGMPIGGLTPRAAQALGLPETVLVVNGGMDQYCGALGAGAIHEGDLMLATGTSWVLLGTYPDLVFHRGSYFAPCHHILPGRYGLMATVPTGGISMEWFRRVFRTPPQVYGSASEESFADIDRAAAEKPLGADGLLFYPHFSGSTCPTWSGTNRAAFLGVNLSHDRGYFARAVMEGVTFQMREIVDAMRASGGKTHLIRMIGGASRSALWRGIVADVTGLPVLPSRSPNSACAGAAMVAAVGAGILPDYETASRYFCEEVETILPDQRNHECYDRFFFDYQAGFRHLQAFHNRT
jgi:sugar (pentulose or hexulose) kinase